MKEGEEEEGDSIELYIEIYLIKILFLFNFVILFITFIYKYINLSLQNETPVLIYRLL